MKQLIQRHPLLFASLIYVGYGLFLLRHEWFSKPRSKGEMEGSVAA